MFVVYNMPLVLLEIVNKCVLLLFPEGGYDAGMHKIWHGAFEDI